MDGIYIEGDDAIIANCVCALNNSDGIAVEGDHRSTVIYNTVLYRNQRYGVCLSYYDYVTGYYNCFYGNECGDILESWSEYIGGTGDLSTNPQFVSDLDYRISTTSPCWDAGKTDEIDPDYSRSDIGVYGGPDAPIYPEVMDVRLETNLDGTINIRAIGKAAY